MRAWWRALAPAILLALFGCTEAPVANERSLLDGRHEPAVLVEAQTLELPPSFGVNRFVSGWLPFPGKRGLRGVVPIEAGARLELVNLRRRPRSLLLRLDVDRQAAGAEVAVRLGDRELSRQPLSQRVRLELPADLPIGRAPLELRFSEVEGVAVKDARVQPFVAGGEVVFRDDSIVQEPWSAIDFVQLFPPGSVLLGRFQPPQSAGDGQAFSIAIEVSGGVLEPVFEWRGGKPGDLRIELPESERPIKVRLSASGRGSAGRWDDLRVAWEAPRRASTPAPPAPRIVLLYVMDALRADFVGHLGGPEGISPTLDRLAAEGVTFSDHLSNAPNTKPSIKSLFIGRPFLARGHEPLPEAGPPTLAESFSRAGYRTFAISGSPWVSASFGTARGFDHRSGKAEYRSESRSGVDYNNSAERVHGAALEVLDTLAEGDRAFMYVHTMNPHNPYNPPEPYLSRFTGGIDSEIDGGTKTLLSIWTGGTPVDEADRARLRGLYAGGLAYNDAELARFLEELGRRYAPGEVLLIVTSDHGDELFERGGVLHGYSLYEEQLRVPLLFWWPGVLPPARVEAGTDHLDLSATLSSLATPTEGHDDGRPLWGLMAGEDRPWPKRVRFAAASSLNGGIFMARSADSKLIWAPRVAHGWGMGRGVARSNDAEYFFDLRSDPEERINLAGHGGLEYEWLRTRLAAWIERGKLHEVGGDAEEMVDEQTLERLRALGYVD